MPCRRASTAMRGEEKRKCLDIVCGSAWRGRENNVARRRVQDAHEPNQTSRRINLTKQKKKRKKENGLA